MNCQDLKGTIQLPVREDIKKCTVCNLKQNTFSCATSIFGVRFKTFDHDYLIDIQTELRMLTAFYRDRAYQGPPTRSKSEGELDCTNILLPNMMSSLSVLESWGP